MIYFFHHYELPAILQQIRIQEMLLQNQAGQNHQTAVQDNLNNNTTANTNSTAPGSAESNQPAPSSSPSTTTTTTTAVGGGSEVRAELNWVAHTAAIITEALSSTTQNARVDTAEPHPPSEGHESGGGGVTGGGADSTVSAENKTTVESLSISQPIRCQQMEAGPSAGAASPETDSVPLQSPGADCPPHTSPRTSSCVLLTSCDLSLTSFADQGD